MPSRRAHIWWLRSRYTTDVSSPSMGVTAKSFSVPHPGTLPMGPGGSIGLPTTTSRLNSLWSELILATRYACIAPLPLRGYMTSTTGSESPDWLRSLRSAQATYSLPFASRKACSSLGLKPISPCTFW